MRSLLEQYVPRVYRFALRLTRDRHTAEDLTQETLLRAWRHRRGFRDPRAAPVWLFRIAVNLWRDELRRESRRPKRADAPLDEQPTQPNPPDRAVIEQEEVGRVLDAMDSLPMRQRQVLYLRACEELSMEQIAEILGISSQAAKSSLCVARKRMRARLEEECRDRFPAR